MLKEFEEEESERKNWRKSAAASIILRSKKSQVNSTSTEINGFLQNAMTIAIIFTGVQLVFSGDLSAGSIIAINMVAGKLTSPIIAAITLFGDRNQLFVLISHIGDIWNKGKEQMGAGVHSAISGKYLFDNISMNFGEVKALNKVSFELTPKSKVGVVGPTGAGKSTLLNMIAGTYRPTEGRMDIDGVGMNQYDLSYYRSQVMLLDKNPFFLKVYSKLLSLFVHLHRHIIASFTTVKRVKNCLKVSIQKLMKTPPNWLVELQACLHFQGLCLQILRYCFWMSLRIHWILIHELNCRITFLLLPVTELWLMHKM